MTDRPPIDPSAGLVGTTRITPDSVTISGRREVVDRVNGVRTVGGELVLGDTLRREVALDTVGLRVRVRPARVSVWLDGRPFPPSRPAPAESTDSAARADSVDGAARADTLLAPRDDARAP